VATSCKHPEKLPFILSEELMETNLLRKAYKKKYRKELPILMEVSSWEVIAKLTEEGLGVGFFPDYVAQNRRMLKEYDLGLPVIDCKVYAISQAGYEPHKNVQAFIEILQRSI
jgi:DNA-binding transcriptional LysR family regulator